MFDRPRDDPNDDLVDLHVEARTHGVRFTGPCLPVCEDGGIVAIEGALDETGDACLVDGGLVRVRVEDVVVGEGFVRAEEDLRLARRHLCADPAHVDHLPRHLRTDPVE